MQAQSKQCAECGATFTRPARRSHAQWDRMTCCGVSCANALRARGGRPRPVGWLDRKALGPERYHRELLRRQAMPRWAEMWEDRRRAEDLADLARPGRPGPCCKITARPAIRQFIAGDCPDCGRAVVVIHGWWHDSIRCPSCTKHKWRMTHRKRAAHFGVDYEPVARTQVFQRDGYRCQLCGRKTRGKYPAPTSPTVDHIIPLSVGGHHALDNLQTACLRCNTLKGNRAANEQLLLPFT